MRRSWDLPIRSEREVCRPVGFFPTFVSWDRSLAPAPGWEVIWCHRTHAALSCSSPAPLRTRPPPSGSLRNGPASGRTQDGAKRDQEHVSLLRRRRKEHARLGLAAGGGPQAKAPTGLLPRRPPCLASS